jgi:cell division protein FtsB
MGVFRELRRRAPAIVGPVLGVSLVGYFSYHLVQGDRGLVAWLRLTHEIEQAKEEQAKVEAERQALERRVGLMRDHIDPDMLDELARGTLNLAGPNEVVIFNREPAAR